MHLMFITMLFFYIKNILRFNLGVAFLKSMSMCMISICILPYYNSSEVVENKN